MQRYANDWNAQKQDKDLLGVFLSLSGKSGLDQSLTPSTHYSHIRIVVVALLMLLWLPSCSKNGICWWRNRWNHLVLFALCKTWWPWPISSYYCEPQPEPRQFLSLCNWICAIQSGAALGESSAMTRGSFRAEGHGQAVARLGRTRRNRKSLDLLECLMGTELGQSCFLGVLVIFCLNPVRCSALKKKLV